MPLAPPLQALAVAKVSSYFLKLHGAGVGHRRIAPGAQAAVVPPADGQRRRVAEQGDHQAVGIGSVGIDEVPVVKGLGVEADVVAEDFVFGVAEVVEPVDDRVRRGAEAGVGDEVVLLRVFAGLGQAVGVRQAVIVARLVADQVGQRGGPALRRRAGAGQLAPGPGSHLGDPEAGEVLRVVVADVDVLRDAGEQGAIGVAADADDLPARFRRGRFAGHRLDVDVELAVAGLEQLLGAQAQGGGGAGSGREVGDVEVRQRRGMHPAAADPIRESGIGGRGVVEVERVRLGSGERAGRAILGGRRQGGEAGGGDRQQADEGFSFLVCSWLLPVPSPPTAIF
jgi:hypothetical protein